jgi:hypothetical protein
MLISMIPLRRRRISALDLIQFAGLILIIGFISRHSGQPEGTPAAVSVILVVGTATLLLMWLTALRARH